MDKSHVAIPKHLSDLRQEVIYSLWVAISFSLPGVRPDDSKAVTCYVSPGQYILVLFNLDPFDEQDLNAPLLLFLEHIQYYT